MKPRSQIEALLAEINSLNPEQQYAASTLPSILFAEDIARLLGISVLTLYHYTGNRDKYGHMLPPWFKTNRRLMWIETDVLEFIEQARKGADVQKRRRGRPTKTEQVNRRASMVG